MEISVIFLLFLFSTRFIWFCLTLTGTMVTLIIIASLWEKFQLYPTITGLDTDFHNWEVPFPTITLCPEDPTNDSLIDDFIMRYFALLFVKYNDEMYEKNKYAKCMCILYTNV